MTGVALDGNEQENLNFRHGYRRASKLTSSDTPQAQKQGFELDQINLYPIDELLECTKDPSPIDSKL